MLPLTLLAPKKIADLLSFESAFSNAVAAIAQANQVVVPGIEADRIILSSAAPDLADLASQFSYPRVCLYSSGFKNEHIEKFRSLSGSILVIAELWASGNFVTDADSLIHYYVDAFTTVLGDNLGDLRDGLYFPGVFDIQFQQPKRGGFGFMQMAKITCTLTVSR